MKRVLLLLFIIFFTFAYTASDSEASLRLDDVQLETDRSTMKRQAVTNNVIELRGPEQQVSLFYEIKSESTEQDQQLVLRFENSELLIAPSSLTVQVDGKPITSQLLAGKKVGKELVVPLSGDALKQGIHEVTVLFYGVIKEGICVEQGTSANWLAIQVDSYFQLNGQQSADRYLADYPAAFIGTGKYPVAIIIPQKASTETLDSALKVGAFLSERTEEKFPVQIKREDDVKSLSSNVLVMGARNEFSSNYIKSVVDQADLASVEDSLILSYETLTDGKEEVDALLAISETPAALAERVAVLTDPALFEQLTGKKFRIRVMPIEDSIESVNTVKLSQFGMADLTLNGANRESQQLFHYAPYAIDKNQPIMLELHMKRSVSNDNNETVTVTEEVLESPVELTILVNDVPHSVSLDKLSDPQEGVYTVQLPIDKNAIKENRMISLQFKASGLMEKNPCVTVDNNHWLYIENDSFFTFPREKEDVERRPSFAQFPSPFIDDEKDETLVVLPTVSVDDDMLLYIYRNLYLNSHPMNWKLADGGDLEQKELENRHALFIGGPDVQPLLKDKQDELAVSYETGKPDLTALGFMQDASKSFGFIQRNLWGSQQYVLMVIDSLTDVPRIDQSLMDFLKSTEEVATVAVLSNNRKVYTNASLVEVASSRQENEVVKSNLIPSIGWLIGFGVLLILGIMSVVLVLRRRKRRVK